MIVKKSSIYWAAFMLILPFSICKAQDSYEPGYAILNDGTRISGRIGLYDDAPWRNQRFIWLKDSAAVLSNPDVQAIKYKVDDLKFYQSGSKKFDKIHFVDTENLQLKSMGSNDHMMERLAAGKINAHRFYSYPEEISIERGTKAEIAEIERKKKNDLIRGYKILAQKEGDSKLHNAFDYDLKKYLEDSPEVWEKYQNGSYGNEPVTAKKGLAARMVALAKKSAFKPEEADAIIAVFNEYNEKNTAKK